MFDPGDVGEWSPPQSPWGDNREKKEKAIHNLFIGLSIHAYAQTSRRKLRLRPEAELPDSTHCRSVVNRPWIDKLKDIEISVGG